MLLWEGVSSDGLVCGERWDAEVGIHVKPEDIGFATKILERGSELLHGLGKLGCLGKWPKHRRCLWRVTGLGTT